MAYGLWLCAENMQNWLLARQVERVGIDDTMILCHKTQSAFKGEPVPVLSIFAHFTLSLALTVYHMYIVYSLSV